MRKKPTSVTIDPELMERLTIEAEQRKISRSALLSMIVNRYYNEKDRRASARRMHNEPASHHRTFYD